jgi:hypothetical protein
MAITPNVTVAGLMRLKFNLLNTVWVDGAAGGGYSLRVT